MPPTECGCAQCAGLRAAIRHTLRRLEAKPFRTALRAELLRLRDKLRAQHK